MFKFSLNWLKKYCGQGITEDEIFPILNSQGFEFQEKEEVGDDLVTAIEVKANRPDMLCHMGIAREINAYKGESLPFIPKSEFKVNNSNFSITIEDKTACKRFSALRIKNIDNTVNTPKYIKDSLESLGINLVNPVVDIINYVMFDIGQPMHCYDVSKLDCEKLSVKRAEKDFELDTLNGKAQVKKGDILVSSGETTVCVAGIVGADEASVTSQSNEIFLESAVFDEVSIRLTSRRMKISTPSSFRFERGVNIESSFDALGFCGKMITEICGGEICSEALDLYPGKRELESISLSLQNTNSLLGTSLKIEEVKKYLEKYAFKCDVLDGNSLAVTPPGHRITVKGEIDLIGEVARVHGYDNIPLTMPKSQVSYQKNEIWSHREKLRNLLLNLGFYETINYSFIPQNTMETLEIKKEDSIYSDIILQNPISLAYALMRPTLVYSLLNCLVYNYSIKNTDIAIFELGRTYFSDKSCAEGAKELDTCGFIMSGIKAPKGWGQAKDLKYDYYDLVSYLGIIMDSFGQEFKLKEVDYKFCRKKAAYEILVGGQVIGFIGQLEKSKFEPIIKNVKLIRDDVFYCEFYIEKLTLKDKKVKFESKYPPVKRLYNFIHSKDLPSSDVSNIIKSASDLIRQIEVKDVYVDKNMGEDSHAVLYEVTYCSKTATLTLEEIEKIEESFVGMLAEKYNTHLKK